MYKFVLKQHYPIDKHQYQIDKQHYPIDTINLIKFSNIKSNKKNKISPSPSFINLQLLNDYNIKKINIIKKIIVLIIIFINMR